MSAKGPSPSDDRWTVGRLLEWTTAYFQRQSIENPRLDVEVLLAHVLECGRIDLYAQYDAVVDERHRAAFKELVLQRIEGRPVAYLVGYREFYTLRFVVDDRVLIPRPETEHVVIEALQFVKAGESGRFLDVGTGSGAIAVTLLHERPELRGVAVDLSADALAVATENARSIGVDDRLELTVSDVYSNVPAEPFDMIVSNPPYVAIEEYDDLESSLKDFEPRAALDGGPGGLDVFRKIVAGAPERLRSGGRLILEIGAKQEQSLRDLLAEDNRLSPFPIVRDLAGLPRVLVAERIAD